MYDPSEVLLLAARFCLIQDPISVVGTLLELAHCHGDCHDLAYDPSA